MIHCSYLFEFKWESCHGTQVTTSRPKPHFGRFRHSKFQVGLKITRKHYGKHVSKFLSTFQFNILQKQVTGMIENFLKLFQPKYFIQRQRKLKRNFLFSWQWLLKYPTLWIQDLTWMHIRRSCDIQDVIWTSFERLIKVVCPLDT